MGAKRAWQIAGGCALLAMALCGIPFSCFFLYCPNPDELIAVKRKLRIGMSVEEAESAYPGGFMRFPFSEDEAGYDPKAPPLDPTDRKFSGHLRAIETCSDQCDGRLDVVCRKGVVTGISLDVWNDFNHAVRVIP